MTDSLVREMVPLDSLVGEVADEFLRRQERGERPDIAEYVARYPEAAPVLGKVLAALNLLEQSLAGVAAPAETTPDGPVTGVLGDFRIVREVGRGGMGVVYEAEQISLGRRVALKVLPFAAALDAKQLQRFKNEAQAAAHLHHNNIVPVHYVGCERGVHFYAMQFIEGHTLAAVIHELRQLAGGKMPGNEASASAASALARSLASGQWSANGAEAQSTGPCVPTATPAPNLPADIATPAVAALSTERSIESPAFFRTVANLGVQAAEALEHAHQLGIIHRDIKPGNLLVDAGGRLWVTDFGLAHCQSQPGLTMTGDVLGTLRYMSPEQALAQRGAVDVRTDVYSLGATLYELLTLEPAYNGRDREEVLRQIAFEEPRPIRRLNAAVPMELETIVLKAMAKSPEERYTTAEELADDLRCFLEHRTIRAKRANLWQRLKKWARRHRPVVVSASVSAVLLLVVAVAALAVTAVVISREKQQTDQALAAAQQAQEDMERMLYYHRIALAERGRTDSQGSGRVEDWLEWCPPRFRGWEWHYLKRLAFAEPLSLTGGLHFVFHPNSRLLAAPQGQHVQVWDAITGQEVFTCRGHTGAVSCVAFSPDGHLLASAGEDMMIRIWDAATGQEQGTLRGHTEPILDLAFHRDSRRLASWSEDRSIRVWDANTAQELFRVAGPAKDVGLLGRQLAGVMFSPDGKFLVSGGEGHAVKFWDAETGSERHSLQGHRKPIRQVRFTAQGDRMVSVGWDDQVKVWDVSTGQELFTVQTWVPNARRGLSFSPDGRLLALGNPRKNFQILDARTGQVVWRLRGHAASVFSVAFSPDGRRLASGSGDGTVRLWDTATGQEAITLRGHRMGVEQVAFSPDGRRIASASSTDGKIRVHDSTPYEDPPGILTLRGHTDHVRGLAFSPDGQRLASASEDGMVKVWDASTGQPLLILRGHADAVESVAFSPDGRLLASTGKDRSVKLWNPVTGEEIRTFAECTNMPWNLVFSPDGRHFALVQDGAVKIRQVTMGEEVLALRAPARGINTIAYSPDGRYLASGSQAAIVFLWDTASGRLLHSLRGHSGRAQGVAFSPDGRYLASSGTESTVFIWDVATGKKIKTLSGRPLSFVTVTWSADGRWIAGGSLNGHVSVWDVSTGREIQTCRALPGQVWWVAFSPDGRRLAASGGYEGWGGVKIWPVPFWENEAKREQAAPVP